MRGKYFMEGMMESDIYQILDLNINNFKEFFKIPPAIGKQIILSITKDILNIDQWTSWSEQFGIYIIKQKEIMYIGRALKNTTFGSRIASHMKKNDSEWKSVFQNKNSRIILYPFNENSDYWSASMEIYLYDIYKPYLNNQRG